MLAESSTNPSGTVWYVFGMSLLAPYRLIGAQIHRQLAAMTWFSAATS
jgi:hypothetical protein